MVYEPLHHKYRPQAFAQLVGQHAIATTLCSALQQQRIPPAYLFCGPRGTGKTSSARILAKSLNCIQSDVPTPTPCGQCETCRTITGGSALDVIEIDAASNTGVDNIRELIERSQFAPVQCRYKVYVIDECHMLSTAAFNALLKTLEEPPERVVFVLATTDPQRVLPTIISRCQRFDFRRIPLEEMVAHLQTIANQEGIAIEPDALRLVAQVSQGGLRDAQSLLDQLSLLPEGVTVERVWDLVGAVPERNLLALVRAIAADDGVQVLEQARHLMDRGREPLVVLQNLASFYRDLLVAKTARDRNDLVAITPSTWAELVEFAQSLELSLILAGQQRLREAEVQVKNTTQPRLWLEVTLLGLLPSSLAAQAVAASQDGRGVAPSRPVSQSNGSPAPSRSAPPQQSAAPNTAGSGTGSAPVPASSSNGGLSSQPAAAPDTPDTVAAETPSHLVQPAPDHTLSPPPARSQDVAKADRPASVPTPATPAAIAPPPSAPQVNIREIWQQVIGRLHPLSKALLKEHGQLLDYTGSQATVGISSRNLLKIAQSKVPDIEKAFAQVVNQPIRISLTVAPDSPDASPSMGAAADVNANSSPAIAPVHIQPNFANAAGTPDFSSSRDAEGHRYGANETRPSLQTAALDSSPQPESSPEADALPSGASATVGAAAFEPVVPIPAVYTEDAVARASRSFAQFFNGQVVELNETDAMFWSATADLAQSTAAASPSPLPIDSPVHAAVANAQANHGDHQPIEAEGRQPETQPNEIEIRDLASTVIPIPSNPLSSNYDDDDDDDDIPF